MKTYKTASMLAILAITSSNLNLPRATDPAPAANNAAGSSIHQSSAAYFRMKNAQKTELKKQLMQHIKNDNLQSFTKQCVKEVTTHQLPTLLREALHNNARNIINYLIDNGLFDVNRDPAVITWTALWNLQKFNQLKPYFQKNSLTNALLLLNKNYFKNTKPEDRVRARDLLIQAGADSLTV